mmetsp:Transcript_23201/g.50229  ORF Transcript_23201/g.50229 Transcript_23201/m.50229 type:complete len:591 (+) Transcript_23201:102-1874(+)
MPSASMIMPAIIAIILSCGVPAVLALSFPHGIAPSRNTYRSRRALLHRSHPLKATTEPYDPFWPSSSSFLSENTNSDETHEETRSEEEILLTSTLDSVVKVYATHSEPDFLIPWQKQHQTTSTSSGFVLNIPGIGFRVMTNAHSVEYGRVVQVQGRGEDEKHEAIVEAVGNECDLALLRVDSLFPPEDYDEDGSRTDDTTFAMPLGPLPSLQDEVEVLGYPAGGDSLCVTKGVVSRIEMQEYAQAGARLLAMQIDAAINPGNSGGPVVNEYLEVVGVAFQGIDEESIENVGYVVPSSVVLHFLEDVRKNKGEYQGFCHLGIEVSFLENATFRKFLKLGGDDASINGSGDTKKLKRSTGVMVRRVVPTAGAYGILRSMDVILAVDGIPLGNDGKIPFRRSRVDLGGYVTSLFEGDEVHLNIWREGKETEVSFPVSPINSLVPSHFNNEPPPYLICSGFVFTALSVPYLEAKSAWSDYYTDNVSYLLGMVNAPLEQEGDEVVVLAQVLAHRANLGYENHYDLHLLKFNDVDVRSLRHLNELISESAGPFMTFEFAPKDGGGMLVVLDRDTNDRVTKEICSEHSIGSPIVLRT